MSSTDTFTHPTDLDVVPPGIEWQSITDTERRVVTGAVRPTSSSEPAKADIEDRRQDHTYKAATEQFADDADQIVMVETWVIAPERAGFLSEKTVSGVSHPEGTWVLRFQVHDDDLWEFFENELAPSPPEARKLIEDMDAFSKATLPAQAHAARSQSGGNDSTGGMSIWERVTLPGRERVRAERERSGRSQ